MFRFSFVLFWIYFDLHVEVLLDGFFIECYVDCVIQFFLAASGGGVGKVGRDTPHPGKGLRPLHTCVSVKGHRASRQRTAFSALPP